MNRPLESRIARLEAAHGRGDEMEAVEWADGSALTLPRAALDAVVRQVAGGRSALPVVHEPGRGES